MHSLSDGQLLRAFRGGDARAFEALVIRHQAVLLCHARALLGPGPGPEDVVQETFLRLAQKPPVLSGEAESDPRLARAHLLSWLHTVTRNGAMDLLRADKRRRRREETVATHESSDGGLPRVEANETRDMVERSLEQLSENQREVLVLRLFGERSYREIAEITGRKLGTVSWLISSGLKSLSVELAPLLGREPLPAPARDSSVGQLRGELS